MDKVKREEAIGYITITNSMGIELTELTDEYTKWRYSDEDKIHHSKLYMNRKGIYFRVPFGRIYLNTVMRIWR